MSIPRRKMSVTMDPRPMNGGKEEEKKKCKRAREHLLLLTVSSTRTTMYGRGSEASFFCDHNPVRPENSVGPSAERKTLEG